MPRISPYDPTLYAAGVSGEGAVLSLNRRQFFPKPGERMSAAGDHWFSPDSIGATVWPLDGSMAICEVGLEGQIRQKLWESKQISFSTFGGRHWAATTWENRQPVVVVDGKVKSNLAPITFGSDGTLAWFPWGGQGLYLTHPDGRTVQLSSAYCLDVRVFRYGVALWREDRTLRTIGLTGFPERMTLASGSCWVHGFYMNAEPWLTYQTSQLDNFARVIAHPVGDNTKGWVVKPSGRWQSKRLDAAQAGGTVIFVFDTSDGDQPHNLSEIRLAVTHSLVSLTPAPEPEPDPKPDPEPEPEPKESTMEMPLDVYNTYCAVVAKFPHTGDENERREANKKAVQTVRARHGLRWITKTEHSNGWASAAKDAIAKLHDDEPRPTEGERQKMFIWDMINGTTRQPNDRGESEEAREAYSLVPPPFDWLGVPHDDAPHDDAPHDDAPPPADDPEVKRLREEVEALKKRAEITDVDMNLLSKRLEKLESEPPPTLPTLVARGKVAFADIYGRRELEWKVEKK